MSLYVLQRPVHPTHMHTQIPHNHTHMCMLHTNKWVLSCTKQRCQIILIKQDSLFLCNSVWLRATHKIIIYINAGAYIDWHNNNGPLMSFTERRIPDNWRDYWSQCIRVRWATLSSSLVLTMVLPCPITVTKWVQGPSCVLPACPSQRPGQLVPERHLGHLA